jgi:transcription antitermination factor NusA-like protein
MRPRLCPILKTLKANVMVPKEKLAAGKSVKVYTKKCLQNNLSAFEPYY